jgi:hypothetical protein
MFSIRRASRALPMTSGLLGGAALLHAALAADAPPGAGIAALAARTPVVAPASPPPLAKSAPGGGGLLACSGVSADSCFEAGPTRLINVGAFFDRRRQTASTHFMLKYFEPPTAGRHRIEGFTFRSNRNGITFPSCGVVRTSRSAPTFPSEDELTHLQRLFVASAGANASTCVDLAGSNFVLEADEAAWLVLQFPDPADTTFVGIQADGNPVDNPCDFLTRDGGDFWFRPDPRQSPLDWVFVVHHAVQPGKQQRRMPWSAIKSLHR